MLDKANYQILRTDVTTQILEFTGMVLSHPKNVIVVQVNNYKLNT